MDSEENIKPCYKRMQNVFSYYDGKYAKICVSLSEQ